MKPIVLLIAAVSATATLSAQNTSGIITYREVIDLNIQLDGEMEAMAAMIPKERRNTKLLYYTPTATLYKNEKKAEDAATNVNNNGMQVMIKMNVPDEITYKDLAAGKTYEQKEFMGRQFLVTGDVKKYSWKMTGNQKEIAGYPCQEATTTRDNDTITVWFTPAIPVSSGPGSLGNLPGMILEAHVGKQLHIMAVKVEPGEVEKSLMTKPKSGKKVTTEEYETLVKEKTKEMEKEYGGSGARIIIRNEGR